MNNSTSLSRRLIKVLKTMMIMTMILGKQLWEGIPPLTNHI